MTSTTVVLVPGGFTGAWMWADVAVLLEQEGFRALALDLLRPQVSRAPTSR